MKVHRNSKDGFQIEFRGVLLTMRENDHHGISGSVTVAKKSVLGKRKLYTIKFHGKRPGLNFPVEVHDEFVEE